MLASEGHIEGKQLKLRVLHARTKYWSDKYYEILNFDCTKIVRCFFDILKNTLVFLISETLSVIYGDLISCKVINFDLTTLIRLEHIPDYISVSNRERNNAEKKYLNALLCYKSYIAMFSTQTFAWISFFLTELSITTARKFATFVDSRIVRGFSTTFVCL